MLLVRVLGFKDSQPKFVSPEIMSKQCTCTVKNMNLVSFGSNEHREVPILIERCPYYGSVHNCTSS